MQNDLLHTVTERIACEAEAAADSGTFGVGGGLIETATGRVLTFMRNTVLAGGRVRDPTAHVERQTIDWYFDRRAKGEKLPPPSELTLLSTLEPCMMCGGSILAAGVNVMSMSHDAFAGVNHDKSGKFTTLAPAFARAAVRTFGYFGVEEMYGPGGAVPAVLDPAVVTRALMARVETAFLSSVERVKATANGNQDAPSAQVEGLPWRALGEALYTVAERAEKRGGRRNAAAMVSPDGRLLMVRGGKEHLSPIRTAFMTLTRDYAHLRRSERSLPHPKHCRVVLLKGPGREAADIADMGAYGSTMEGPTPGDFPHLQYVLPSQPQADLDAMMDRFPPLYRDVIKVRPVQVKERELVGRLQR